MDGACNQCVTWWAVDCGSLRVYSRPGSKLVPNFVSSSAAYSLWDQPQGQGSGLKLWELPTHSQKAVGAQRYQDPHQCLMLLGTLSVATNAGCWSPHTLPAWDSGMSVPEKHLQCLKQAMWMVQDHRAGLPTRASCPAWGPEFSTCTFVVVMAVTE